MGDNLRDRTAANLQQRTNGGAGTAVATRDNDEQGSLAKQIERMQSAFDMAMPRGAEASQLVRDALTCLRKTPKLAECYSPTVLGALMTCAQLGLRPGVLGQAWVLPFYNRRAEWVDDNGRERKGRMEAQLIIGYQGYLELAKRSGLIDTLIARPVHEHDEFEIDYGIKDDLVHKPLMRGDRGPVIGFYAIVKYTTGGYAFWYMNREEVEEHRDKFAMTKTKDGRIFGVWVEHFESMALKTVFLRLVRWMPKDTEMARAVYADERVRLDAGDPRDKDAMLSGIHPVLDAPADEEPPPIVDVGGSAIDDAPEQPPAPTEALQTEFPEVMGKGTDAPPVRSQMTRIHTLLGEAGITDDETRWAVLGRIAGRDKPLGSATDMTRREAGQVQDYLERWHDAGVLTEQLAAVLAAAQANEGPGINVGKAVAETGADPLTGKLPDVGTKAWHDAGHPVRLDGGTIEKADKVLTGDCGVCEQES